MPLWSLSKGYGLKLSIVYELPFVPFLLCEEIPCPLNNQNIPFLNEFFLFASKYYWRWSKSMDLQVLNFIPFLRLWNNYLFIGISSSLRREANLFANQRSDLLNKCYLFYISIHNKNPAQWESNPHYNLRRVKLYPLNYGLT